MKNRFVITLFLFSFLLLPLAVEYAGATTTVPTPLAPSGTITDTTPTYKWSKITGATKYRFKTIKGSTTKYTITVPSSVCGSTTCKKTPTQVLSNGSYTWKVQAYVNGAWKTYSAYKTFSLGSSTNGPKPGYWSINTEPVDFYVTTDGKNVEDFAGYFSVPNCGNLKITNNLLVPIVNGKTFSFTGGIFYANGTFDSSTTAHGSVGLDHLPIPPCGITVTGGPYTWTAIWKDSSQPSIVVTLEESDLTLSEDTSVTVEEIEASDPALIEGIIDNNLTIELEPDNQ